MSEKLPSGYMWVTGSELMSLETEMKKRTTLRTFKDEHGELTNDTIRSLENLQKFMWEMEMPKWMHFIIWTDKYQKQYRSRIALQEGLWMTDKRVRDQMIANKEI